MPRTIDSLSPKQQDSRTNGSGAGDVYRPKDSGPIAGSVVKPLGVSEPKEKSLKGSNYHSGDTAEKVRRRNISRKLTILGVVAVVALIVVGGVSWYLSSNAKAKDKTQSQEVAKQSLSQLEITKNLSDQDKIDFYKQAGAEYAAAKKIGIDPDPTSDNDNQTLKMLIGGSPTAENSAAAVKQFIENRLEIVKKDGFVAGYTYNFWFGDKAIKHSPAGSVGSAQAVAEDKNYASEKADSVRQRLQNGSVTPDQLVDELKRDSRLRLSDGQNGSGRFASARPKQATIANDTSGNQPFFDTIATMQSPGLSPLLTRSYISSFDDTKTPVEAAYQIVQLTKVVSGDAAAKEYEQYLKEAGDWQW